MKFFGRIIEDAKEMEDELLNVGYQSDHIKVLLNRRAKAEAIVDAVDWLITNEEAGDEVVFFYSSHGYRAPDDDGWDADVESDGHDEMIVTHDHYGLQDGWFKQKFAAIESKNFALMFGSCHSGGMFHDNDDLQGTGTSPIYGVTSTLYNVLRSLQEPMEDNSRLG